MGSLPAVVRLATTTVVMRIGLYTSAQSSYAHPVHSTDSTCGTITWSPLSVGRYLCDSRYAIRIPAGTSSS